MKMQRGTFLLLLDKYLVFLSTERLITWQATKPRTRRGISWFLLLKNLQPNVGKSIKTYMLWEAQYYRCVHHIRKSRKRDM